jgi:hypothetical protein
LLHQVYLDSRYADFSYSSGTQAFWLSDPLTKPEGFFFKVHVLSVWIPLTYYDVFSGNNRLDIAYTPSDTQSLIIPDGNRNIDFIIDFLNVNLRNGYEVTYEEATNRLSFLPAEGGGTPNQLLVLPTTISGHLLGLALDVLNTWPFVAQYGVDMTRTSSILIRTNLHATNRDPYTRSISDILCKVPVTHHQPNEVIEYTRPAFVRITNQTLNHFMIGIFDDDGRYLDLNGNRYTLTFQVSIELDESYILGIPRFLPPIQDNEPLGDRPRQPEDQPPVQASG